MVGTESVNVTKPRRQRWLRYEFARLASWRNLLIAAIISCGALGIVLAVMYFTGGMTYLTKNSSSTGPENKDGKPQAAYSLAGDKLIPSTPEIWQKVDNHLMEYGVLDGFELQDVEAAIGYSIPNVVYVEQGKGWDHAVAIMPGKKLHHIYTFTYSCGHQASISPDPFRDLMYEDPEAVAREISTKLCSDCQRMREYLDKKAPATPASGK